MSLAQGREASYSLSPSLMGQALVEVTPRCPCPHVSDWFRRQNELHPWYSYLLPPNKPPQPLRQQLSFVSLNKSVVGTEMSGGRLSLCHVASAGQHEWGWRTHCQEGSLTRLWVLAVRWSLSPGCGLTAPCLLSLGLPLTWQLGFQSKCQLPKDWAWTLAQCHLCHVLLVK